MSRAPSPAGSVRYCGRDFTAAELAFLRELAATLPTRRAIADAACDGLGWVRPDGRRKDMSARVALLRMADDGLLTLPPARTGNANGRGRWPRHLPDTDPQPPLTCTLAEAGPLQLRRVDDATSSRAWNRLIATHHYLGHTPLPGAQLRYLLTSERHGILAAAGFAASAWACAARDTHLGWDAATRAARLHLLVGNARFLILPHVRVRHLASHTLARLTAALPGDWARAYGYRPLAVETFVERDRFTGASYRAANWTHVGATTGRGKCDRTHQRALAVKDVYLYPLHRRYRELLTQP